MISVIPKQSEHKIVYSPHYGKVNLGAHVFPVKKYDLIRKKMLDKKLANENDFIEALMASDEDVLLVHTKSYFNQLNKARERKGNWLRLMSQLEMPFCTTPKQLIEASLYCVGGTYLSSCLALENGIGIHLGGGFHHAYPDHGEGFCVVNDVAIAIRKLQQENKVKKVGVIDCDLHQGNGTAYIFRNDSAVYTFSIHAQNIYPAKEKSDRDIGLPDHTDDQNYIRHLKKSVPTILADFNPDLVLYLAGADPYMDDVLSPLNISKEGLRERDKIVISESRQNSIPISIVLAGGYAQETEDTVEIHFNTIKMALSSSKESNI